MGNSEIPSKKPARVRFIGDFKPEDFSSPKNYEIHKKSIENYRRKIHNLQRQVKRLTKKVESLNDVISSLKDKGLLTKNAAEDIEVCISK